MALKIRLLARRCASLGMLSVSEHAPRRAVALLLLATQAGAVSAKRSLSLANQFKQAFRTERQHFEGAPGGPNYIVRREISRLSLPSA